MSRWIRLTISDPLVRLASNLFHIPLYAGLAFCLVKALSKKPRGQEIPWGLFGLAFVGYAACAVSDEWHQFFVPGRVASVRDFLLDLVGIGGMLFILRCGTLREMDHDAPIHR